MSNIETLIERIEESLPKVGEPENVWCQLHASDLRVMLAEIRGAQQLRAGFAGLRFDSNVVTDLLRVGQQGNARSRN